MDKIKKLFKSIQSNGGLRLSFTLYVAIGMVIAIALIITTYAYIDEGDEDVALHLVRTEQDLERINQEENQLIKFDFDYDALQGQVFDDFIVFYARNIYLVLIFVGYSLGVSILMAMFFYRRKLKKPVKILVDASKKIAERDLDFKVEYAEKDEMGLLCDSFEMMRSTLESNNAQLWKLIDEQRRVHNAFSHDIRTPLTVVKGYTDLLIERVPENQITEDKLIHTLELIKQNVQRLENFTLSMSKIQKLSDIVPEYHEVELEDFFLMLNENSQMSCDDKKLIFNSKSDINEATMAVDFVDQIIMNIVANAVRFADEKIVVNCEVEKEVLTISVHDDGDGFTKNALENAQEAYFSESNEHFGLGLHICMILCKKIGANIELANGNIGAVVKFTYPLNNKDLY